MGQIHSGDLRTVGQKSPERKESLRCAPLLPVQNAIWVLHGTKNQNHLPQRTSLPVRWGNHSGSSSAYSYSHQFEEVPYLPYWGLGVSTKLLQRTKIDDFLMLLFTPWFFNTVPALLAKFLKRYVRCKTLLRCERSMLKKITVYKWQATVVAIVWCICIQQTKWSHQALLLLQVFPETLVTCRVWVQTFRATGIVVAVIYLNSQHCIH